VLDGSLPARAWREIGLPWSPQLVERSRRSVGATIAAARTALLHGCGVNLAGGTHHAYHDKGSGFCVFNDVAVASRLLLQEGLVRRILVLDLDVHQGNGTAAIFRDEPRVFTFPCMAKRTFPSARKPARWTSTCPTRPTTPATCPAATASASPAATTA
jgi:acetoin utilization deacetylase AcuC-like enzyme